jgi:signal transduction histidine kinase
MVEDLPYELKALAAFLKADNRPTAIFGEELGDTTAWEPVYTNEAFRLRGNALEDATKSLARANGTQQQTGSRDDAGNTTWTQRTVSDGFVAVTLDPSTAQSSVGECAAEPKLEKEPLNGGDIAYTQKLDWIKYPGDNLSKWQQFFLQHAWENTPLGPLDQWPFELRSAVISATADPAPRTIYWGPQNAFIYNESFSPIFGVRHPEWLGQPLELAWRPGIREAIWPYIESAYRGNSEKIDRLPLELDRHGFLEETYWDATLTPAIGPDGHAAGVQNVLVECTRSVRGERRRFATGNLGKHIASAATLEEVWSKFLSGLQCEVVDLPYAAFYEAEHDLSELVSESTESNAYTPERTICTLHGTMGVLQPEDLPKAFMLADETLTSSVQTLATAFATAWKEQRPTMLGVDGMPLPPYLAMSNPDRGFGDTVKQAVIIPVTSITSRDLMGVLIIGLCPRVPLDEGYHMWLGILGDLLLKAAAFISLPLEQRRAQKLSDDVNSALAQQLRLTTLQAERSDAKFSRMARLAPIGMFVLDPEGMPLYVNDAYRKLVPALPDGSAVSFNKPSDWTDFIHPDDVCLFWAAWEKVVIQKHPSVCEYRIQKEWRSVDKATGEETSGETWLMATSFPEIEPDGRVSVIMGWITDISKQKAAENLLSQRLEDALETKRQSENFIDMTSHEIRNPISAIMISADSIVSSLQSTDMIFTGDGRILTSELVEDIIDAASTINLCAQHQKRIVDDILTLSKLDASLLEIAPDKVQPPQLVEKALQMYSSEIARAEISARLVIEPTYDALAIDWVVLDPSRLLQIVINLLTNAIKFSQYSSTREITIYIGASYERPTGKHHGINFVPVRHAKPVHTPSGEWGDGEDVYIQLAITDTGSGLTDEQTEALFQRFAQASPKTYKQYGGSGLGLFISRELCELQGGQIGVCSREGRTSFTFYVKAKRWVESSMEELPPLSRFVSASSSPMVFSRRGSAALASMPERAPTPKLGPVLNSTAEVGIEQLPKILDQFDAEELRHLHVLVVEGEFQDQGSDKDMTR